MTEHVVQQQLPMVSIVVPIYNVRKYIEECLQSIASQTYPNIEAILVDDCTCDDSAQLAQEFIDTHNGGHVHYRLLHHKQNMGLSVARNTGIKAAHGQWIYFLDSDDTIEPQTIETLVSAAQAHPKTDVVYANMYGFQPNGRRWVVKPNKRTSLHSNEEIFSSMLKGDIIITAWNKLIPIRLFEYPELMFEPGLIHEDQLWSFNLATRIQELIYVDQDTYYYRTDNPNSLNWSRISPQKADSLVTILEKKAAYLPHCQQAEELARHVMQGCFYTYASIVRSDIGFWSRLKYKKRIWRIMRYLRKEQPLNYQTALKYKLAFLI